MSWYLSFKSMLARIRYSCCSCLFIYCCIFILFHFGKGCSQPSNNQMSHTHIFNCFWWCSATIFLCSSKKAGWFIFLQRSHLRETIISLSERFWNIVTYNVNGWIAIAVARFLLTNYLRSSAPQSHVGKGVGLGSGIWLSG